MIRAIFFDFYSVWLPDAFGPYIAQAQQHGPEAVAQVETMVDQYFYGQASASDIASHFRQILSRPDIEASQFMLSEQSISPALSGFMRELHGHFVKLGVLANLGSQEFQLLTDFNAHNQVFEVIAGPLPFRLNAPLFSSQVFSQALQTIGEPPRNCLVVTGDPAYQNFAASLGMTPYVFAGFPKLKQDLDQMLASELS